MSVRVLARIRPLLKKELDKDVILTAENATGDDNAPPNVVRMPNPKKESESFSFQFQSVYDQDTTQQELFDKEVAPTVKHLFNGFDVTVFAYGVTGSGKTHTMKGGKSLADRGVIPRLLSSVYRRCRKLEKDGETQVDVAVSYYEIYNDRVYDLFEPPEKRTAAGLPIRDNNGKTVVVGLTERPCTTLKDFEKLYDEANVNRSTSATKLNAQSSRSHAILCVTLTQTTDTQTRVSRASCIDLAGSEDNRRTDNNRERLVESSAINKSLFVLAQCVEAISKKQHRIPYRESKMTRILSLGQNNGLTLMILNLAPIRSYHLDTLSSLTFASRTKKIEVNEVENEPVLKAAAVPSKPYSAIAGPGIQRQPLKPLAAVKNADMTQQKEKKTEKPAKSFAVFSEKPKAVPKTTSMSATSTQARRPDNLKRGATDNTTLGSRPSKRPVQSSGYGKQTTSAPTAPAPMSKEAIEAMIEKRIEEKLAERALNETSTIQTQDISEAVQRRLEALEERVGREDDDRGEGLHFLLMAKQHHVRGEYSSALKMYQLALPHFPDNEKLEQKIASLQEKVRREKEARRSHQPPESDPFQAPEPARAAEPESNQVQEEKHVEPLPLAARTSVLAKQPLRKPSVDKPAAPSEKPTTAMRPVSRPLSKSKSTSRKLEPEPVYQEEEDVVNDAADDSCVPDDAASDAGSAYQEDDSFVYKPKPKTRKPKPKKLPVYRDDDNASTHASSTAPIDPPATTPVRPTSSTEDASKAYATPRTKRLLGIINTRDLGQIRMLKGVGAKKAEAIVNCLCEMDDGDEGRWILTDLEQLAGLKGVGVKTVENMRQGIVA
ncbi:P-loop containing nucleoside triphosphate hydrolase protein [Phyllosticta capitalensis]|uniref:P-loop containing nucleoside triphosphate hydrolase protein n=1 Tax=Phyllosticta capitalensis TaxID=121624 RepID=A0ABR1YF71_9PEZI